MQTADEIVGGYPEVFQRELGALPGTVHLEVKQGATSIVAPPCHVLTSLKKKLKTELDRLQQLEVIAPISEPTPWVSSPSVAVKKSGVLRICIDPRPLNTALKRERYQLPVLTYLGLEPLEGHRPSTTVRQRPQFWAIRSNSLQVQPVCLASASRSLLQVFFGRPLFLFA